jgi:hypothetical protein
MLLLVKKINTITKFGKVNYNGAKEPILLYDIQFRFGLFIGRFQGNNYKIF